MLTDPAFRRRLAAGCLALLAIGLTLVTAGLTGFGVAIVAVAACAGATGWWFMPQPDSAPGATQDVIAHVSHELRTPLTSVVGLLELLEGDDIAVDPEERKELLNLARTEAQHIEHVVGNLHAAARLADDRLDPVVVPVDLVPLIARVVDRFPSVARRTYLPSGEHRALADPQLTTQIMTNLIQNIERYAPDGEVAIRIEPRDDMLALTISDDGPGIDEATRSQLFEPSASGRGLGIGLSLSRRLALAMGGALNIETSRRRGATFALLLPETDLAPSAQPETPHPLGSPLVAHAPRARLLVDLAAAFTERSLDRTMAGIHRLYVELLGATGTVLMVPDGDAFQPITSSNDGASARVIDSSLTHVLRTGAPMELTGLNGAGVPQWQADLGGNAAIALPVTDADRVVAVLAVAFEDVNDIPSGRAGQLAAALAQLAAFAIHRSKLASDVAFERTLRSSVMEALPIAISVFAGDPPRVVDWNQRERDMLGLTDDSLRPSDLDGSQAMFNVRFADGTPLTVDNAPVTAAIRTGRSAGPFLLNVQRADGSEVTTRTYCAPFFSEDGRVAGAVVTSEELDVARPEVDGSGVGLAPSTQR